MSACLVTAGCVSRASILQCCTKPNARQEVLRSFHAFSRGRSVVVHHSSRSLRHLRVSCSAELPNITPTTAEASEEKEGSDASSAGLATLSTVRNIIASQLGVETDTVLPNSTFFDLGADSLDTVEIMMALEEEFDISLDEDGAGRISTVQEAADMIDQAIRV